MLATDLSADQVIAALRKRSQQGKLPGFRHRGGHTFSVSAFGSLYDKELVGAVAPRGGESRGSVLTFEARSPRRLPAVVAIVVLATFWPGVWLTHSLIGTYFHRYPDAMWVTAVWYLPLCVLAIPPLWKQYRRSLAAADESARETVGAIAKVTGGEVVEG